jgi:hypothetical protein
MVSDKLAYRFHEEKLFTAGEKLRRETVLNCAKAAFRVLINLDGVRRLWYDPIRNGIIKEAGRYARTT